MYSFYQMLEKCVLTTNLSLKFSETYWAYIEEDLKYTLRIVFIISLTFI